MALEAIYGYCTPRYKRFQEYGEHWVTGALGGVEGNAYSAADIAATYRPYEHSGYRLGIAQAMNTGFGRMHHEHVFGDATLNNEQSYTPDEVVDSILFAGWFMFGSTESSDPCPSSDFIVFRQWQSSGYAPENVIAKRYAIAIQQHSTDKTKGRLSIWKAVAGPSDTNPQFTGTLLFATSYEFISTYTWYWIVVKLDAGLLTLEVNESVIASVSAPATGGYTVDRVGIKWESFGFRSMWFADLVVMRGSLSDPLPVSLSPCRVTTLFPASDISTGLPATTMSGYPYHYQQIFDRPSYPFWYSRDADALSYVQAGAGVIGSDLYSFDRATPVGTLLAVAPIVIASVANSSSRGELYLTFRKGSGPTYEVGPVTLPKKHLLNPSSAESGGREDRRYAAVQVVLERDPIGDLWDEEDWVGGWQVGLKSYGTGPSIDVSVLAIERLHQLGSASGARYIAY